MKNFDSLLRLVADHVMAGDVPNSVEIETAARVSCDCASSLDTSGRRAAVKKVYTKKASRSRRSRCPRPRGRVAGFEASGETATLRVVWPVGELLAALREGLSRLAVEGGLLIAQALLADSDSTALATGKEVA